jgi:hypothetical protein
MKQTLAIALVILGMTFNLSPVHAWKLGGVEGQHTCKDIVAVSKLITGGTTWTSSQTTYAHSVRDEAKEVVVGFLQSGRQAANKGDREAQTMLRLLDKKGVGKNLSINDLTVKAMQRVHLAEARVLSLGLDFPQCIGYGLGAYAGS